MAVLLITGCLAPATAWSQTELVTTPPPNLVLSNYNSTSSGTFGQFQFALGLNRQNGSADDVTLRNLLNGEVVHSAIDVHIAGFTYSLAYQF